MGLERVEQDRSRIMYHKRWSFLVDLDSAVLDEVSARVMGLG